MSAPAGTITLADAVRALGARRTGRDYRAPCPAHGGDGPNLSLTEGARAELVVYCHSRGCEASAILAAIRERVHGSAHGPASSPARTTWGAPLRDVVAQYRYDDAAGCCIGQMWRYEETAGVARTKTFRPRHPDGRAAHKNDPCPALLTTPFHLPAVRAAIAAERPVFVVEGEKDVETLATWDLVATCNASGAEKWRAEHAAALAGITQAYLLPDNDAAGRRHMAAVARSLLALPRPPEVRVLALPGLEEKGDVTDWACVGGTREELLALVRDLAPVTLATVDVACGLAPAADAGDPNLTPAEAGAYPRAVCLLDAEDGPPPSWHVPGVVPKAEPVLVVGEGGTMKSTIVLHLAVATSAGGSLFGQHPIAAAPVVILSGEDSIDIIKNRCEAIARGHGWNRTRAFANLHVLALVDADLADPGWRAHLVDEVTRLGAQLVVLDPLADLATGEENDNTARREVVASWRALAKLGATPVLVHHVGKATADKSKTDRIRGASAIASASRCTYFLQPAEGGTLIECLKMSRAARPAPFVVSVEIATAPDNPAVWESARFTRLTRRKAAMTQAETAVLACAAEQPGLSGNALRKAADVSSLAFRDATNSLQRAGRLRFEPGPRESQLWYAVDDPDDPLPTDSTDSDWSGTGSTQSARTGSTDRPLKGPEDQSEPVRAGDHWTPLDEAVGAAPGDAEYEAAERAALEEGL